MNQGTQTSPDDLMNFGAHATLTYEIVAQGYPSYCEWVLNTVEMEADVSPQLARFAHYLMMREDHGAIPEGAIPMNTLSDNETVADTLNSSWDRASYT